MDAGQLVFAFSRLILGALAAFFAIMLWSKTRDAAWMLIVIGVIVAYIGIVHSVLEIPGVAEILGIAEIAAYNTLFIGSVSLVTILLPALSMVFFIAALLVMVIRQRRRGVIE
jgi:hypothetical protein